MRETEKVVEEKVTRRTEEAPGGGLRTVEYIEKVIETEVRDSPPPATFNTRSAHPSHTTATNTPTTNRHTQTTRSTPVVSLQ